mgnify:CR=1 FL=1
MFVVTVSGWGYQLALIFSAITFGVAFCTSYLLSFTIIKLHKKYNIQGLPLFVMYISIGFIIGILIISAIFPQAFITFNFLHITYGLIGLVSSFGGWLYVRKYVAI